MLKFQDYTKSEINLSLEDRDNSDNICMNRPLQSRGIKIRLKKHKFCYFCRLTTDLHIVLHSLSYLSSEVLVFSSPSSFLYDGPRIRNLASAYSASLCSNVLVGFWDLKIIKIITKNLPENMLGLKVYSN